ncbi:formin-2-like [Tupaia chinensis]|uniref:formin-2-like n=1 Tax=Tupaia chinensis TaxID=246437 RepID=UPI000FFBFE13|nr:formin-2-like [Tupaia chinensis]
MGLMTQPLKTQRKEESPFAELPNLIHPSRGSSFGARPRTVVYLFPIPNSQLGGTLFPPTPPHSAAGASPPGPEPGQLPPCSLPPRGARPFLAAAARELSVFGPPSLPRVRPASARTCGPPWLSGARDGRGARSPSCARPLDPPVAWRGNKAPSSSNYEQIRLRKQCT